MNIDQQIKALEKELNELKAKKKNGTCTEQDIKAIFQIESYLDDLHNEQCNECNYDD